MTPVRAKDLFLLYRGENGDVAALRGLNLELHASEVVSVLGPSGSGKTSLLDLCAGFRRPSGGELAVLDRQLETASHREIELLRRSSIGIVRQHYHRMLPRELTVEQIVGLPLRLLGREEGPQRREVQALLERAGLLRRARAYAWELSGGEQQRVALCAALAKHPKLLLADEPTGELGPRESREVIELLLDLIRGVNGAALIVTHDADLARRTDRTIQIRDGRVSAEGEASEILLVDDRGWLRVPRRLREQAGLGERVRAKASQGRVELLAEGVAELSSEGNRAITDAEWRSAGGGLEVFLDRVTKTYGDAVSGRGIVNDFTSKFAPGRFHVIAGPSGSGKTTLLNLIACLARPTLGEVWVGGKPVSSLDADEAARWRANLVGYMSQHSTMIEFLTARENVELGLTLRGFAARETRREAEGWLDWVGLRNVSGRRADRLSGGEQRRVALARALAPNPRLLLADEPTAHLDRVAGRRVIALLHQVVHEMGATVIAAGHDEDLISAADSCLDLGLRERPTSAADTTIVPFPNLRRGVDDA